MTKQKQIPENKKHAHRSQQQLTLQAHKLDDMKLNVKTWKGKTITVEIDTKRTVDTTKRQIQVKTNPERSPASRVQRKSPDGQKKR